MKLTKQQLNKKLRSKILTLQARKKNLKDLRIMVVRARNVDVTNVLYRHTSVTVKISGEVKSSNDKWLPLQLYRPNQIRKFLRRKDVGIVESVSKWVRLWGFDSDVSLETIDIVNKVLPN